jgi:RimJ/RimL family protein N-acetyltransferase
MTAPRLDTERLTLRAFALDDFAAYAAMHGDPVVMRHMGDGDPDTEEQSWASFLKIPGHWLYRGYGSWALEERATGRFVGSVGFTDRKRDRGLELRGVPEMGWTLAAAAFGKGYATEAVQVALRWACGHFGSVRVIALTTEDNAASMRVAQKCGFREFKRGFSAGRPRVFFDRIL